MATNFNFCMTLNSMSATSIQNTWNIAPTSDTTFQIDFATQCLAVPTLNKIPTSPAYVAVNGTDYTSTSSVGGTILTVTVPSGTLSGGGSIEVFLSF